MSKRRVGLAAVVLFLAILGCRDRNVASTTTTPPDRAPYAEQAAAQMRESIREVTDVLFKQAAVENDAAWKDAKVTDVIRQYEALSPDARVKFIVDNSDNVNSVINRFDDDDNKYQRATTHLPSFFDLAQRPPADFNLAIAKLDVYARQVKLTNELFNDADTEVMSAIQGYERLDPKQKQAFLTSPDAKAYVLYWQVAYLWQKAWLLQNYRRFAYQTEWGYKTPAAMRKSAELDDRQFDLHLKKNPTAVQ